LIFFLCFRIFFFFFMSEDLKILHETLHAA